MDMGKGWRTIVLNGLTFLAAFLTWDDLSKFLDPQVIVMGQAAINVGMRFLTTTAVGGAK